MKRIVLALLMASTVLASVSCTKSPVLTISGGKVRGVAADVPGVTVFKGIPFAAPPVDSLRWAAPRPVIPWEGVKVADTWGPAPWQEELSQMPFYGKEFYSGEAPQMSEDCLYLNVWAPSKTLGKTEAKLPVAVWIHGGAFTHGYGYELPMDGTAWAQNGVILVTINYRVGMMGFFASSLIRSVQGANARPADFGLFDQFAALAWVKDNIGQFGGDPSNITVMGQSAGAMSIKLLVSSPITIPLISKAIIQSGGGIDQSEQADRFFYEEAEKQGDAFCAFAGYETREQLYAASAQELMEKYDKYTAQGGVLTLRPCLEFGLVGSSFTTASALNRVADIPYLIGYTTGDPESWERHVDQFCASRNYFSGAPVYQYRFARELPGDGAGAFHSAELWYMFGTLDRCWRPLTEEDKVLSDEMIKAWTNFCRYGNPCGAQPGSYWPAFTADYPYRKILDVGR